MIRASKALSSASISSKEIGFSGMTLPCSSIKGVPSKKSTSAMFGDALTGSNLCPARAEVNRIPIHLSLRSSLEGRGGYGDSLVQRLFPRSVCLIRHGFIADGLSVCIGRERIARISGSESLFEISEWKRRIHWKNSMPVRAGGQSDIHTSPSLGCHLLHRHDRVHGEETA